MPNPSARIAILIPAFNEQGKIGNVLQKIPHSIADGIFVIDDCSTDNTGNEARALGAKVIRHTKNTGVGGAIRSGIEHAIQNGFDIAIILSGDDQHDPSEIPGLLAPILNQGYDFVQGSRRLNGLQAVDIQPFRRFTTWMYTLFFRALTGFHCTDATNGGRAFRLAIFHDKRINLWQDWLNTYELEPYLFYTVVKLKYKVTEAPMKVIYHKRGTTKMKPFRDWWRIFRPLIFLALGIRK